MANKINFITGETYTLAELFSGERRIVIPDLQRDYCWGDATNKKSSGETGELVSDFVKSLLAQYDEKGQMYDSLNLGLFYGYEVPADHIQLCDGQQRLTTLFLVLGMLNKMTGGKFRQHLISDFEFKHDDKEPYLNYAIRESSLYFLSDLVCCFFTCPSAQVEDIKKSEWYFADYNLDPSIQSMLAALKTIEGIFKTKDDKWAQSFGIWMLNRLTFMYFDMGNRKNGEETFVIINTTGEPLSATQNLKPLVIKVAQNSVESEEEQRSIAKDVANRWEEVETWFWNHRQGDNDTADAGFAEFLRWVYMIEKRKELLPPESQTKDTSFLLQQLLRGRGKTEFPYKNIDFKTIYRYWLAVRWIFDESDLNFNKKYLSPSVIHDINERQAIGQNDCFVLLPILKYVADSVDETGGVHATKLNAERLRQFFVNLIRLDNVSKAVNSLVGEALEIVVRLKDGDIVTLLDNCDGISKQLLTEEEQLKIDILRYSDDRINLEKLFWKAQEHPVWNGEIMPIISLARKDEGKFDKDLFAKYEELLDDHLLSGVVKNHDDKTFCLRRALIVAADDYKPVSRGSYVSFGWEWSDWHKLFASKHNRNKIREFLNFIYEQLNSQSLSVQDSINKYIKENLKKDKKLAEFAEDDYLISFTKSASSCDMISALSDWQICTTGGTSRHTSVFSRRNAYILKAFGGGRQNSDSKKIEIDGYRGWAVWYWPCGYDTSCVVVQNDKLGLKLDVRYLSENKKLEIVLKPTNSESKPSIENLLSVLPKGSSMKENHSNEAVCNIGLDEFDEQAIKQKVLDIVNAIDPPISQI